LDPDSRLNNATILEAVTQKNIEAVCSNEAQIRHEVKQTVLHELGHYFGMDEAQLKDV
jgi:predicted Zn-dependent protease with MMP-like domain